MNPSKARVERTTSKEHLLQTIFFDSGHLQHERKRPGMERKHMSTDKTHWKSPRS